MTDSAYVAGRAAARLAELDTLSAELAAVQRDLLQPASQFGPVERRRLESREKEISLTLASLRQQVKRDMSPSKSRDPSPNSPRQLSAPMHSVAKMPRAPAQPRPPEVVPFGLDHTTELNAVEKELTQIKKRFASGRLSEKERIVLNNRGCDLEEKSRQLRQTIRDHSPPQQKRSASPTGPGAVSGSVSPEKMAELNKLAKEMNDIQKKLLNPRASEAEKKRLAEIERRQKLQAEYESSILSAITSLESFTSAAKLHADLRRQLDPQPLVAGEISPLDQERKSFEKSKKSLKSDLKKCTAFVKKIKSGSYHTPTELNSPNNPIRTLNLTRYVEEVATALTEPQTKVKQSDIPGVVLLCVEMHRRYENGSRLLL